MSIPSRLPPVMQHKEGPLQQREAVLPAVAGPVQEVANQVLDKVSDVLVEELPQNISYQECSEQFKGSIEIKDYKKAFILADLLYSRKLRPKQKAWVLGKFEKLCTLGLDTLEARFYAFMRTALTRELALQPDHNPEDVIRGYSEAWALGYSPAAYNLACYHGDKDEYEEALAAWIAGMQAFPEEPIFCNNPGYFYANGLGTEQNLERAIACYQKGCDLGCGESAANLADLLQANPLGQEERQRVIELYTTAKYKNVAMAAWNLGVIYQNGWYMTDSQKRGQHKKEYIDLVMAEVNFRKAYEIYESKIRLDPQAKEDLPDCALAIAEVMFADESRYSLERWDEMLEYIEFARKNGREDEEFDAKIREKGRPAFANAMPIAAGKAPMKRLLSMAELLRQEDEQEEEQVRAAGAEMVMHFCVALKSPAKQPADHEIVAAKGPAKTPAKSPAKSPAHHCAAALLGQKIERLERLERDVAEALRLHIERLERELKEHPGNDDIIMGLYRAKYKANKVTYKGE